MIFFNPKKRMFYAFVPLLFMIFLSESSEVTK